MVSCWDIEKNILKLVILGNFLPFYPLKTPKIKILKNETIWWRYHHFTHVYLKITIIWCMVPEIRSEKDHPLPHSPLSLMIPKIKILKKIEKMPRDILLNIHVHHKWRSYDIWFLKYKVWQTEIFVILGHFLSYQPPDNPQNQNFKIEKKNTWR